VNLLLQDDKENKKRSALEASDDEIKKKSSLDLLLGEDKSTKDKADLLAAKEDEAKAGKKKDLLLEEEAHEREKKEAITKEEKNKKSALDLGLEDDAEDESKEKTAAEFVDKYYRNNELEKNNEEDGPAREKAATQIKLEKERKEREQLSPNPIDEEDDSTKNSLEKLKLSNETEENSKAVAEAELEQKKERSKVQLQLETEKKELEKKESNLEEETTELDKKTNLNLIDDESHYPTLQQEKENTKKDRKNGVDLDMDKDTLGKKGNHGKVDHIDTHYGMKHADRKVDQNWDKLGDTDNVSSLAEAKKRKEAQARPFEFDVKKDDGFSYEKVEKDFSDVDPFFRNLKDKYGSIDYENNIAIDKSGNKIPLDEALEAIIAENLKLMGTAVENLETDEVFLVSPLGITGMIEASNYYHNKKKKGLDLLKYLAQKILDDYGAATTFILYDLKNKTQKNWYCGHIELELPKTNRGDRDKHWQAIFNDNQNVWKATNEVTTSEQFLIYPLQEGITTLGLGVVEFLVPVDENKIIGMQNILSCALGLYYQEYHASLAKKEVVQKVEGTASATGSGFFNKVFGFFKNKAS
jgi:hypothetical protein